MYDVSWQKFLIWIKMFPCQCQGPKPFLLHSLHPPFTFTSLLSASKGSHGSSWVATGLLFPPTCSPAIHSDPGPVRAEQTHGIRPTGPLMATSWSFKTCAAEWRAIVQTVIWWPEPKGRQSQVPGDSPLPFCWGYSAFFKAWRWMIKKRWMKLKYHQWNKHHQF